MITIFSQTVAARILYLFTLLTTLKNVLSVLLWNFH